MKRFLSFIICLFAALNISHADESCEVSILTCSPGEQVYELFGHTALQYTDHEKGVDLVFNYGLFSFEEPNFIWRFVLGETDYILGVTDYDTFLASYAMRGSSVTRQILNLDSLQKKRLFSDLMQNLAPQNRKYRYNFLFNNCTTKARDKVFDALGAHARIGYTRSSPWQEYTFRDIIHNHTADNLWYRFGMDLLLGASADKKAGRDGAQFAPLLMQQDIRSAHIITNSDTLPLMRGEYELLQACEKTPGKNNLTPFNAALLLLMFTFVVMLCERRSKKTYFVWDILLMGVQGTAGAVLLFMALFSQHPAVDSNWLLMWLNPLPLFLLPLLIYKIKKHKTPQIMWVQIFMVSLFVVLSPFLPQSFPTAIYPCAMALIIRSLFHIYKNDICALD